jgi:hypothetical protein
MAWMLNVRTIGIRRRAVRAGFGTIPAAASRPAALCGERASRIIINAKLPYRFRVYAINTSQLFDLQGYFRICSGDGVCDRAVDCLREGMARAALAALAARDTLAKFPVFSQAIDAP